MKMFRWCRKVYLLTWFLALFVLGVMLFFNAGMLTFIAKSLDFLGSVGASSLINTVNFCAFGVFGALVYLMKRFRFYGVRIFVILFGDFLSKSVNSRKCG